MSPVVTLTLSDATIERAQRLARQRRSTLEEVLTDWLEHGAPTDDIFPLAEGHTYHIYTPLGMEKAAEELYKLMYDINQDQAE